MGIDWQKNHVDVVDVKGTAEPLEGIVRLLETHVNEGQRAEAVSRPVSGMLAKTQKISQTIAMGDDPNQFTTTAASVQSFDPTGTLLVSGCATATGRRFE